MANINMNSKQFPNATAPILEFVLPKHEIGQDLKVGQLGEVTIPVEVVAISEDTISFRKAKAAKATTFKDESLDDMRNRIGEVKELEK